MRDDIRRDLVREPGPRCMGCLDREAFRSTPCGPVCGACYRRMFHPDHEGEALPAVDELNTDPWTWADEAVTADA